MNFPRTIKIFLASSITELKVERDDLSIYLAGADIQNMFLADRVIIQLIRCEDIYSGNSGERPQEILNQRLRECNMSIFLFKTKAGERTQEELNVAKKVQKEKEHNIIVYCKNVSQEERSEELKKLIEKIDREGPDRASFDNIGDVKASFIKILLKYERELLVRLGERYETSLESMQFNTAIERTERVGEEHLREFEFHKTHENQLQKNIYHDIEVLFFQVDTIMSNSSETIANRIYRTREIYSKIDYWATKTNYNKEKHFFLLCKYAKFLYNYGLYYEAETVYKRQIKVSKKIYKLDSTIVAQTYKNLGMVYDCEKKYELALIAYYTALNLRKKNDKKNTNIADLYICIGIVYSGENKNLKALWYFFRGLKIRERNMGEENSSLSLDYNNVGWLLCIQDRYKQALKYLNRADELDNGLDKNISSFIQNNLGFAHMQLGHEQLAKIHLSRAIKIREEQLGEEHPDTIESYINLGYLFEKMMDYNSSIKYFQKALCLPHEYVKPIHHVIKESLNFHAALELSNTKIGTLTFLEKSRLFFIVRNKFRCFK